MKYIKFFFITFLYFFLPISLNAEKLKLPEVTAEYVCNTRFIIGITALETRTFYAKNKKRIDTIVNNVPQSVIINYETQEASWVWPRTLSYLTILIDKKSQEELKKVRKISYLKKIKSDYIHGFEVDIYKLKMSLPDGTTEESTRWISKQGVTLKEVGFIDGKEGKIHFHSEFSNVKVFKQDERLFEIPEDYILAPVEQLDDINELLKIMVKRS